jgi:predicted Zn-dependent peptidase
VTSGVRRFYILALASVASLTLTGTAQVQNWPSERPPRALPAREVKFPPYAVHTLANGLQVIAVSHHEQPAVSIRIIIRAGGAQDPPAKPGVAYLASALLDQGTTTRNAEQIATAIDSIGGIIGTGAVTDLSSVNAIVMKDSLDLGLDMVSDIVRNPAFAPEEIERQRQQMLSGLKVSYDDPDYLAGVVFDRLVYGFHPYGRPHSGTPASIASITREDLLAFHKAWFGANNAILAIVGDVGHEEAFAGAERAFGKWGRAENAAPKPVDAPPPTRRVVVIDRPGAVQTEIRVGHAAVPRRNPDYLALDIATKILGGEGGNRLHRVLRSDRGLTYGASADINALKEAGDIVAETDTRSETTGEALRLIVDEFWRLQRQRVEQRELADAQAYLTGSFPLTIETPSAIALQILNAVFYGLDLNELQTYRERVNAITVDDIQRVARQYLHPDRLAIVLVGDASAFASQLAGVGFDQFERIPIGELDLASADLRRHATHGGRENISFSPERPTREERIAAWAFAPSVRWQEPGSVKEIIDRAVRAKGGLDKLRSIRTVKAIATTIILDSTQGRTEVPTTTSIRYPGAFRVDADLPAGTLTQVFNAGEFWIQDTRGARTAPPEIAAVLRGSVQRDAVPMLLGLADGKLRAKRVDEAPAGRPLTLEVSAPGMRPVTVAFDPDTSLIVSERYAVPGAGPPAGDAPIGGATMGGATMEEVYSDYRNVDGVQVAFKTSVRRNGETLLERVVRTLELNPTLAPTLFTKPN